MSENVRVVYWHADSHALEHKTVTLGGHEWQRAMDNQPPEHMVVGAFRVSACYRTFLFGVWQQYSRKWVRCD